MSLNNIIFFSQLTINFIFKQLDTELRYSDEECCASLLRQTISWRLDGRYSQLSVIQGCPQYDLTDLKTTPLCRTFVLPWDSVFTIFKDIALLLFCVLYYLSYRLSGISCPIVPRFSDLQFSVLCNVSAATYQDSTFQSCFSFSPFYAVKEYVQGVTDLLVGTYPISF